MFYFMNFVRSFVNYVIFCELCDRMRFEVDCAKSHHRVISEGLSTLFVLIYHVLTGVGRVIKGKINK